MRNWRAIGFFMLFSAFIVLNSCQLENNKAGNAFSLEVLLPGNASKAVSTGARAAYAKSLADGTNVRFMILTQAGATWASSPLIPINGKTSVTYTFVLPPSGTYQVATQMLNGSGLIVGQSSAPLTVPMTTSSVVLTMYTQDDAVVAFNAVDAAQQQAINAPIPGIAYTTSAFPLVTDTFNGYFSSSGPYITSPYTITGSLVDNVGAGNLNNGTFNLTGGPVTQIVYTNVLPPPVPSGTYQITFLGQWVFLYNVATGTWYEISQL